jgi:hypothetical protein
MGRVGIASDLTITFPLSILGRIGSVVPRHGYHSLRGVRSTSKANDCRAEQLFDILPIRPASSIAIRCTRVLLQGTPTSGRNF